MLLLLLLAFLPLLWLSLVLGSACQHRTLVNSWIRQVKTAIAYSKKKIDHNSFNLYNNFTLISWLVLLKARKVLNFILWKWISEFEQCKSITREGVFSNGYTIVTMLLQRARSVGFPLATLRGNKRRIL